MIVPMHQSLSIIGRGKAGRSLAAAWGDRVSLYSRDERPTGWVLLAVPDDSIQSMAQHFSGRCVHLSGSLNFTDIPCAHPLTSFDGTAADWTGSPLAMTGEVPDWIVQAFESIGFCPFSLAPEKKALYHATAVISSGHAATLWLEASRLLKENQVDLPGDGFWPLVEATVRNIQESGAAGRTGPFVRGDRSTIERDLESLPDDWKEMFRRLGDFYK